nr:type II toxin-antitoxin system HicB family antitoxin [Candidatus Freyarchaeota archaeon]
MLVKFEVYNDGEYWCARGIGVDIFTQGKTLDELMGNVKEAVELHFDEVLSSGEDIQILSIFEFVVHSLVEAAGS